MTLIEVCLFTFCADLFGYFEYDIYPYEIKFEILTLESHLTLQNISSLKNSLELQVKLEVENTVHDMLSIKVHMTLDKLAALANSAKRKELNIQSCYDIQKAQVRDAFQKEVHEMAPCVAEIEPKYDELSSEVVELEQDAEALITQIKIATNKCKEESPEQLLMCLQYQLQRLEKKQKTLQYTYNKLNERYHETLLLIPPLVECMKNIESGIVQSLYRVLVDANQCYMALEEEASTEKSNSQEQ